MAVTAGTQHVPDCPIWTSNAPIWWITGALLNEMDRPAKGQFIRGSGISRRYSVRPWALASHTVNVPTEMAHSPVYAAIDQSMVDLSVCSVHHA